MHWDGSVAGVHVTLRDTVGVVVDFVGVGVAVGVVVVGGGDDDVAAVPIAPVAGDVAVRGEESASCSWLRQGSG
jgi:hypothetical protein